MIYKTKYFKVKIATALRLAGDGDLYVSAAGGSINLGRVHTHTADGLEAQSKAADASKDLGEAEAGPRSARS